MIIPPLDGIVSFFIFLLQVMPTPLEGSWKARNVNKTNSYTMRHLVADLCIKLCLFFLYRLLGGNKAVPEDKQILVQASNLVWTTPKSPKFWRMKHDGFPFFSTFSCFLLYFINTIAKLKYIVEKDVTKTCHMSSALYIN